MYRFILTKSMKIVLMRCTCESVASFYRLVEPPEHEETKEKKNDFNLSKHFDGCGSNQVEMFYLSIIV